MMALNQSQEGMLLQRIWRQGSILSSESFSTQHPTFWENWGAWSPGADSSYSGNRPSPSKAFGIEDCSRDTDEL